MINDLADVYAVQTETAVAAAFKAAATHAAVVVATNTLADWTKALYLAAADSLRQRVHDAGPDLVLAWTCGPRSGSLVDVARVVFPPDPRDRPTSTSAGRRSRTSAATFSVCPGSWSPRSRRAHASSARPRCSRCTRKSSGCCRSSNRRILGVQVAYGGYVTWGSLAGAAFVPLTPPAGITVPTMMDVTAQTADDDDDGDDKSSKTAKKA